MIYIIPKEYIFILALQVMKEMVGLTGLHRLFHRLTDLSSRFFSSRFNPLHHLGSIIIFLLIIDVISGIYLFVFYKIDPRYSYSSVEAISSGLIGMVMRGFHRYSSDALILTTLFHALHVIITDRFRLFRWIAWFTGIVSLIIFVITGVSGYILVWDTKAQVVGIFTGKFLSYLPIFGHDIMSTFFGTDIKYIGGLFRMLLYAHIALTILIVFILWLHVMRNARPRLIPPRFLWVYITVLLVLLSIVLPARSDPEASLSRLPFEISVDWFYFFLYPPMKGMPLSWIWLLIVGLLLFLILFPWLIKGRRNPVVRMVTERCTGCEQCYMDCPYEAVIMARRDREKKSYLLERKCAGCGICVGSCSFGAIEHSLYERQKILEMIKEKSPEVVAIRCAFGAMPPEGRDILTFTVPCIGVVHPDDSREILREVKGLILIACEEGDCYYREGNKWMVDRYERRRRPFLKKDVEPSRIWIIEAPSVKDITLEVNSFIKDLKKGKKEEGIVIRGYRKVNYILASLFLIIPAFALYPLSVDKFSFYPDDRAVVVLSFKYRSSPSLAKERSPIKLHLTAGNREVYSKTFYPRGLRKDASIFVYDEIILEPHSSPLKLYLEETFFPEKKKELTYKEILGPGKGLIISYDDARKELFFLGP